MCDLKPAGLLIALACLIAPALPRIAAAQDGANDRYTLEKSESGFVRLDRQTGAVTLCTEAEGTLTCRMGADERAAYDADLARLEKRVETLERQLASGRPAAAAPLPSDAEIDRSIGIMERFMRAFFNLVQEFRDDEAKPTPDRT
ncbi:hypothetical protein [Rhizobium sp. AG855]|uniref:hypothetical protein n=1 Tax=Rhizobium sp. AG855 TaxID=2183898 RepID=UPI000E731FDE|nr:hypothetical protein [Rhizobium sp. AG855]RKE86325.1 hypothetical protein DFO46_3135 [Rhizobium sp. AG855]